MSVTLSPSFQFHKGTIKTYYSILRENRVCHFNSIKVRLKPVVLRFSLLWDVFQFHKGTIKT